MSDNVMDDIAPGPPCIVNPSAHHHTHTVVFLHGRGDTAPKFMESLAYSPNSQSYTLVEAFPTFRWVFPRAPITRRAAFTGDKISQWFDVWNVSDFSDREDLQAEGLYDSVGRILSILEEEAASLDGRWEKLILMGMSQGAATIIHTLLHLRPTVARVGACIAFSCRMPFIGRPLSATRQVLAEREHQSSQTTQPSSSSGSWRARVDAESEVLEGTPVLLEHCANDPLVQVESGRQLRDILRSFGSHVIWKEYGDGGHWFNSPAGIDDAVGFLREVLDLTDDPAPMFDHGRTIDPS